jgi:integrase
MSQTIKLPGGVTLPRPRGLGRVRKIKSRRGVEFDTWQPELRVKDSGYQPLGQTFPSEGEAWQALLTAHWEISAGQRPAPGAPRSKPERERPEPPTLPADRTTLTVKQWGETWLANKTIWPEGAPRATNHSTIKQYRAYLTNHVNPKLGDRRLVDLQEDWDACARWVKWLREKSAKTTTGQLDAKTVQNIFAMTRTMLDDAVRSPSAVGVDKNPLLMRYDLERPSKIKAGVRTPKREEVDEVLELVPDWVSDTMLFAIYTGLRYGEYAGLQRKHRLYENGVLTHVMVEQTLHTDDGTYFGPTKTHATRWQPLNQTAREALERSLTRWPVPHETDCTGEPCSCAPEILLWRSERGKVLRNSKLRTQIEKALKKSKKIDPFRVHDLRRAFGQWLQDDDVEMSEIQKLYGHGNERTTRIYVEAGRTPSAAVVNRLDRPGRHLKAVN